MGVPYMGVGWPAMTFGWGPCSNFEKTPTRNTPLPAFEWVNSCAPTERGPIGDDHPSRCTFGGCHFGGFQHPIFKGSPKNRYMKRRGNDFTQNRIRESKVSHFDCSLKILGPALQLVKNLFILMKGHQTDLYYPLWTIVLGRTQILFPEFLIDYMCEVLIDPFLADFKSLFLEWTVSTFCSRYFFSSVVWNGITTEGLQNVFSKSKVELGMIHPRKVTYSLNIPFKRSLFGGPNSFIVPGVHGIFRLQILWWGEAI